MTPNPMRFADVFYDLNTITTSFFMSHVDRDAFWNFVHIILESPISTSVTISYELMAEGRFSPYELPTLHTFMNEIILGEFGEF